MLAFSNCEIEGKYLLVELEGGLEGRDAGADGYNFAHNKVCNGDRIATQMSFDDALKACNLNDDCDCIRDDGCDGEDYSLDKNTKEILSVIPDDDLCIRWKKSKNITVSE